eukprot:gb/GECG01012315.1/.p1 GENE.gb/GECG01012315.1/~~gb/GECG01012315.1/.p1  ORF type:complete len:203 (+),score=18.31 gb/GECG01012315.1/:1-609(+)
MADTHQGVQHQAVVPGTSTGAVDPVVKHFCENSGRTTFALNVAKADFKFNAAHMMMASGKREKMHGHNYTASVMIKGVLGDDGYVLDFGVIKRAMRKICKQLDEHFLVAINSQDIIPTVYDKQVELQCSDGCFFSMPLEDCVLLPIVNTSAEELCRYLCQIFLEEITLNVLQSRGVSVVEVSLMETPQQEVSYQVTIPERGS